MNWDDLNMENKFNPWQSYKQSKLANVLFALELSNRYGDSGITAVSVEPGFVRSEIFRELKSGSNLISIAIVFLMPLFYMIAKNGRQGAQTSLYCALDDV